MDEKKDAQDFQCLLWATYHNTHSLSLLVFVCEFLLDVHCRVKLFLHFSPQQTRIVDLSEKRWHILLAWLWAGSGWLPSQALLFFSFFTRACQPQVYSQSKLKGITCQKPYVRLLSRKKNSITSRQDVSDTQMRKQESGKVLIYYL